MQCYKIEKESSLCQFNVIISRARERQTILEKVDTLLEHRDRIITSSNQCDYVKNTGETCYSSQLVVEKRNTLEVSRRHQQCAG